MSSPTSGSPLGIYAIASPVIKSTASLNWICENNSVVLFFCKRSPTPVPSLSAVTVVVSDPIVSFITFFSIWYEGIDDDAT